MRNLSVCRTRSCLESGWVKPYTPTLAKYATEGVPEQFSSVQLRALADANDQQALVAAEVLDGDLAGGAVENAGELLAPLHQ